MDPAFLILPVILLTAGLLLYLLLPYPMALRLLRPPRMTDAKAVYVLKRLSPTDLGMAYEDVSYFVRDERTGQKLKLAAWWIPNPARPSSDRTVLLVHGYADAKVGAIAWAPLWHSLGYHILAVDLRAHGESDGTDVTAGYFERHDLSQVIDQLRAQRPAETRHVALFGISLGAAVVTAVASLRDDLTAVILECPYADYLTAVTAHADLMGMPGPSFVRRALHRAQQLTGADFSAVAPVKLIPQAKCPVMVISAGQDPLVAGSLPLLEAAVAQRTDGSLFWEIEGAYHVEGLLADADAYRWRIETFLAGAAGGPAPVRRHQMRSTP
jgi:pimeloyl-ACP methyl ester carboxylesterase